ncbi:MAG: lysylphosphatidylglycerol synthase transmembrane domain-containing protein [Methanobacteriaceae archaeon]|nr:lysylphosphatidylglycerol synthase transmembrane domain-containing protein [Methanobacteriaceae archaeon]
MNIRAIFRSRYFKILFSLILIFLILSFVNFKLLIESLMNIKLIFFIAILLIPMGIFFRSWRLFVILNKDIKIISLKNAYILTLVGIGLNIFLPASMGDIAKSYYGYKWYGSKEEMLSASIVDKIIALLSIFIIGCVAAFFLCLYDIFIFSVIITIFLLLLVFLPNFFPWSIINKFYSLISKKKMNKKKLERSFNLSNKIKIITIIISIFGWLVSCLQLLIICESLNITIGFIYILAVASLINLAILFPLTLNGLGSSEAMIIFIFGLNNISPTLGVLVSFIYTQIINAIIPGFFGLLIIIKNE